MGVGDRALRLARKLRGRSATEMRERARQAGAIWLERAGLLDAHERSLVGSGGHPAFRSAEAWREHWRRRSAIAGAPRFFAGLDDRAATVEAVRRLDRAHVDAVVARAARLAAGRFDLLGYEGLDFGSPIDWHLDPVAGVRAPMAHWSRIAYLDPRVAGDHKVVWELNRHQWLVTLGMAYWLTGDERHARVAVEQLRAWLDANPPKRGVNWASSLEVAFRAIAWCWVLHLLRDAPSLDAALFARLTGSLAVHARHLERNLSTWFSPNTHLTGEALGLFHVGLLFPELPGASRWREHGWRVLIGQLPIHARPDGVYFEQAAYYHRYTVDFYLHLLVLAERNEVVGARAAIGPQLERLVEHLVHVARRDGTAPLVGDEDGGHLAWLDERRADDVRSPIASAALLFRRPDFAYVAGAPTAELVWLLGPRAPERLADVGAREPVGTSRAFPDGGIQVLRDGWGADACHLVFDCGPHGMLNCGHAHADALAYEASVGGRALLVDPGTYVYSTDRELRDWFRATEAHNALAIDGESSSVPDGPFHWRHIARSETLAWHPFTAADWVEGRHDGYERLPSPAVHRRGILFVKGDEGPHYWVVRDVVESTGEHAVAIAHQCAPEVTVAALDAEGATLAWGPDPAMRLAWIAGEGAHDARIERDERWVSRRYGARRPATRLTVHLHTRGPASVVSVLLPLGGVGAGRPTIERVPSERGLAVAVRFGECDDLLLFDVRAAGDVVCDAPVAWVRRRHDAVVGALVVGGRLTVGEELALRAGPRGAAGARIVREDWLVEGDGASLEAGDPARLRHSSLISGN